MGRRGTDGVDTNAVAAKFMLFDRGTFWVLPLTHFCLPNSARAYLFSNLSEFITFAAAPLVLTPFVRSQGPLQVALVMTRITIMILIPTLLLLLLPLLLLLLLMIILIITITTRITITILTTRCISSRPPAATEAPPRGE